MARIRTIKPEFFTSEDIASLTPLARLLYIALWCESDREGRLDWKPRTFKLRYFPADDCDINELCNELIERKLVIVYEIEGQIYAEIPTFKNHQVINNRESESTRPPRVHHASTTRESGRKEGRKGKEGKGREVASLPSDLQPTDLHVQFCANHGMNVQEEFEQFCSNAKAKNLTYSDWNAAFRTWLGNSAKWEEERKAKKTPKQSDEAWWGRDCE